MIGGGGTGSAGRPPSLHSPQLPWRSLLRAYACRLLAVSASRYDDLRASVTVYSDSSATGVEEHAPSVRSNSIAQSIPHQ